MGLRLLAAPFGLALAMAALHGDAAAQSGVSGDGASGPDAAEGGTWRTDLAAAIREATLERRPLLAVFR